MPDLKERRGNRRTGAQSASVLRRVSPPVRGSNGSMRLQDAEFTSPRQQGTSSRTTPLGSVSGSWARKWGGVPGRLTVLKEQASGNAAHTSDVVVSPRSSTCSFGAVLNNPAPRTYQTLRPHFDLPSQPGQQFKHLIPLITIEADAPDPVWLICHAPDIPEIKDPYLAVSQAIVEEKDPGNAKWQE
ncbi:hypothetical protein EYF80_001164 [Liparis tanakae]|uniref:Uncharacterized protein n=1 Tax=Liparis tanakae TaxID=230148 RepID=A0A4Z2JGL3_9TELE|nr:hypothetical protein EYF80_001164 [Liparis tanakae]